MTRLLLAGAAALGMMTNVAMAQSSDVRSSGHSSMTEETTTITPAARAPWTNSSSATTARGATADGDQTASNGSSSTDNNGNRTETTITNTSYPLTAMITTVRKTTVFSGGTATETVTTTNTYPASYNHAPESTTASRTYVVGSK